MVWPRSYQIGIAVDYNTYALWPRAVHWVKPTNMFRQTSVLGEIWSSSGEGIFSQLYVLPLS